MRSVCPADSDHPLPVPARDVLHSLARCAGGWECTRCGLTADPSRRAAAARARCTVPEYSVAGSTLPECARWVRCTLDRMEDWLRTARGMPVRPRSADQSTPVGQQDPGALRPWRPHVPLGPNADRGPWRCVWCPQTAHARSQLVASACPRTGNAPRGAVARAIRAGGHDLAISQLQGPDLTEAARLMATTPEGLARRIAASGRRRAARQTRRYSRPSLREG